MSTLSTQVSPLIKDGTTSRPPPEPKSAYAHAGYMCSLHSLPTRRNPTRREGIME